MKYVYFGSSEFSNYVLDELLKAGMSPALVVTTPAKPRGRGLVMTSNTTGVFAVSKGLKVIAPEKLDSSVVETLKEVGADVFVVASYGKIMPLSVIDIPARKTLNIHPSLLPKYRGASPLPTTILEDVKETGISIMQIDEKMDHGPIVAVKPVTVHEWPVYEVFEENMAREGGRFLVEILPAWVEGKIEAKEQDHAAATFTKKIKKEDALVDIVGGDAYQNFRKIQAYHGWPQAYFMANKGVGGGAGGGSGAAGAAEGAAQDAAQKIRVKINAANFAGGKLTIDKVTPEGGRMMDYKDFLKGYKI